MSAVRAMTQGRCWLVAIASILVASISLLAFGVSFAVLRDLAERSGVPGEMAWAWPLIVDGSIVAAMLAIFAARGREGRATVLPWVTLIGFALVSVVGNGVHTAAVYDHGQGIALAFAIFVGAVPPIGLLTSSEMLVRLLAPHSKPTGTVAPTPGATVEPVSATEGAPDPAGPHAGAVLDSDPAPGDNGDLISVPATGHAVAVTETAMPPDQTSELDQVDGEAPARPEPAVAHLRTVEPHAIEQRETTVPTAKDDQVAWIVERAGRDEDVTRETLAIHLGVSIRTAQRRLADARAQAPDAFSAAS